MGEHKRNQTAIAAKNGTLPPKVKSNLSKLQRTAMLMTEIEKIPEVKAIKTIVKKCGGYYG